MSEYARSLSGKCEWHEPRVDGSVYVTADGHRWRIERPPTVGDLVHVGDFIRTNYETGGLVTEVSQYAICACPFDEWASKICEETWAHLAMRKWHREFSVWSITYVKPEHAKRNKRGEFYDSSDYCFINECVAFDGRILALFENSDDEVMVEPTRDRVSQIQYQLRLL